MSRSKNNRKRVFKCGSKNCDMCRENKQHKNVKRAGNLSRTRTGAIPSWAR